jgi:hypothetical protein
MIVSCKDCGKEFISGNTTDKEFERHRMFHKSFGGVKK